MKKLSDYRFLDSWQLVELNIKSGDKFIVLFDVGDLTKGESVEFVGFDDVDNHYGIFVFTDSMGKVLDVPGDYSGPTHPCLTNLKKALEKIH